MELSEEAYDKAAEAEAEERNARPLWEPCSKQHAHRPHVTAEGPPKKICPGDRAVPIVRPIEGKRGVV